MSCDTQAVVLERRVIIPGDEHPGSDFVVYEGRDKKQTTAAFCQAIKLGAVKVLMQVRHPRPLDGAFQHSNAQWTTISTYNKPPTEKP
jgi:hypothetical protein